MSRVRTMVLTVAAAVLLTSVVVFDVARSSAAISAADLLTLRDLLVLVASGLSPDRAEADPADRRAPARNWQGAGPRNGSPLRGACTQSRRGIPV